MSLTLSRAWAAVGAAAMRDIARMRRMVRNAMVIEGFVILSSLGADSGSDHPVRAELVVPVLAGR
jgi:hypothetical protein